MQQPLIQTHVEGGGLGGGGRGRCGGVIVKWNQSEGGGGGVSEGSGRKQVRNCQNHVAKVRVDEQTDRVSYDGERLEDVDS